MNNSMLSSTRFVNSLIRSKLLVQIILIYNK